MDERGAVRFCSHGSREILRAGPSTDRHQRGSALKRRHQRCDICDFRDVRTFALACETNVGRIRWLVESSEITLTSGVVTLQHMLSDCRLQFGLHHLRECKSQCVVFRPRNFLRRKLISEPAGIPCHCQNFLWGIRVTRGGTLRIRIQLLWRDQSTSRCGVDERSDSQ